MRMINSQNSDKNNVDSDKNSKKYNHDDKFKISTNNNANKNLVQESFHEQVTTYNSKR